MVGLEGEPCPMFFSPLKIDLFLPIQQTPCILNQWMKDERYHLSETHWSTQQSRNCLWTWVKILYVHTQLCVIQAAFSRQDSSYCTEKLGKLLVARGMHLLFWSPTIFLKLNFSFPTQTDYYVNL